MSLLCFPKFQQHDKIDLKHICYIYDDDAPTVGLLIILMSMYLYRIFWITLVSVLGLHNHFLASLQTLQCKVQIMSSIFVHSRTPYFGYGLSIFRVQTILTTCRAQFGMVTGHPSITLLEYHLWKYLCWNMLFVRLF